MGSRVGVWLSNFGNELYLQAAIDSVLKQTFTDFTLYIVDNHSPGEEVKRIIAGAAGKDPRIVVPETPKGLAGIPHQDFCWRYLNDINHDYTIPLGGHDFWNTAEHLQIMVERMDEEFKQRKGEPEVALLYSDTWQVNEKTEIVGRFQNIMQIGQVPRPFIPQVVITTVDSPQLFGLWNERVRKRLPIRHLCGGWDHLIVMHAALLGMIMWEPRATLVMRAPPPTDGPDKYGKRHFSPENLVAGQKDFIDQLEWCVHCVKLATEELEPTVRASYRMMLTASIITSYFVLRGSNLMQIPGAYQQFTANPLTIEAMKGSHHTLRMVEALIKSSKPITQ